MQKEVYEFVSKQSGEPIVERKTCKRTGEKFAIFQGDQKILETISPTLDGKKYLLPTPTLSPVARMIRRMMFRNERGLYSAISEFSQKKIPSMYHPDTNFKSVDPQEWEDIDMSEYGQEYDSQLPFMQQFENLFKIVPKMSLISVNNENGKYDNFSSNNKNTYLNVDIMYSENVSYSTTIKHVKNGYDLLQVHDSELVYDCLCSSNLTKCVNVWYSNNCYDCGFSVTCRNCINCWFCDNLENQQNYLFNKPATKEKIQAFKDKMKTYTGFHELQHMYKEQVWNQVVRPATWAVNCENTIGSTIYNSQNAFFCFDSYNLQDCRYCMVGEYNTDCMDTTVFNRNSAEVYEAVCGGFLSKSHACITNRESSHMYFCELCLNCEYCIGCTGLKNKKYCILNKQYTKEERYKITENIIKKMSEDGKRGEFFPSRVSPFAYNDTVVMDYFPVKKIINDKGEMINEKESGRGIVTILEPDKFISDAILDLGGEEKIKIKRRTRDKNIDVTSHDQVIHAKDLPDNIDDVQDDICEKIIICQKTKRPFKITLLELAFYRKMGIALPRVHPVVRHQRRTLMRPPRELYFRTSDKTGQPVVSNYSKDVPFKVYTQEEYEKLMY